MIGRIQEKNISVPLEATVSTNGDGSVQDPDFKTASSSFGVANTQDGFEKVEQNDLLNTLGLSDNSVIDPIGYPGEEWLWENLEVR